MYRRPRWALPVIGAGLVVVLLGLYAVDRALVAVGGTGPLTFLKPPLFAVRDGWIAGGERSQALRSAEELSGELALDGATPAGTIIYAGCREGINSYKSSDGYRLSCRAAARSFQAWSGDFEAMRDQARAEVRKRCPDTALIPFDYTPRRGITETEIYDCGAGVEISLSFGTPTGLLATNSALRQGEDFDTERHVSGPTPEELLAALQQHRWFVIHDVSKVYYQDQP